MSDSRETAMALEVAERNVSRETSVESAQTY